MSEPVRATPWILVAVVLCLSFSGCVGQSGVSGSVRPTASSTATAPPPPAEVPNATEEFGSIAGNVMDDEQRPLVRAEVTLVEPGSVAITDEEGAFTFNGLAQGKYSVVVNRIGYEQAARRVEVQAGEVTQASFTLAAIIIAEPHQYTYDRIAYIGFGNVFLQDATWAANVSALNQVICDPCQFVNHIPVGVAAGLTEVAFLSGQGTTPYLNQDAWITLKRNWTTGAYLDGKTVLNTYFSDREAVGWTKAAVEGMVGVDKLMILVHGGIGLNVQHKIQIYNTMGYGGDIPKDFTALPPE